MSILLTWEAVPARTVKAGQHVNVRPKGPQLVLRDAQVITTHDGIERVAIEHHGGYLYTSADYVVQVRAMPS